MYVKSLKLKGFRSFQEETVISFESNLTTLVGENNTGKSTVGLALHRLFTQTSGAESIQEEDYSYGLVKRLTLEVILSLSPDELKNLLLSKIIPDDLDLESTSGSTLRKWLLEQGSEVKITFTKPGGPPYFRWGTLGICNSQVSTGSVDIHNAGPEIKKALYKVFSQSSNVNVAQIEERMKAQHSIPEFQKQLSDLCSSRYKMINEFRVRSKREDRKGGVIESMDGQNTANVLLTLKNHPNPHEKSRYIEIQTAFKNLFPHYSVDAVEREPGSNNPDVQFYEEGRIEPLSLDQVSAGVNEVLTLITNLVARKGLVVFLEHPELHLHPHGIRWLKSFLANMSEHNQIIVVTHDTNFISSKEISGLRRFWWVSRKGTRVCSPNRTFSAKEVSQIETALRHVSEREIVFARCVLLVEDESLKEFLITTAPILGYDVDAYGVSILYTGGHGGHRPFHTVLDSLGIPYVNFRDKTWGDNVNFPPDTFFSLGMEFEPYMDNQGLADIRKQVVAEAGGSHRRQAKLLAEKLVKSQIPQIFDNVLKSAIGLATGKPAC